MSTLHTTQRHKISVGNRGSVRLRVVGSAATLLLGAVVWPLSDARAAEEELSAGSSGDENSQKRVSAPSDSLPAMDTIVVRGEKTERSIYDTSASVEVYDERRMAAVPNASSVSDLLKQTPNVVDVGIGNDLPTIRGIDGSGPAQGANAFLNGTRPRMNMSVDGRSLTYNELAFGPQSLWDVERVEIFRGPQSYIQGRNAIAGAVVITSKDPSFEWEQAVKGAIGNHHSSQTAAMISGPVVEDQLAFRLSVDRQRRRSDADLTAYAPVGDPREIEVTTSRAKLLYNPAALPELTSRLSLNHYDTQAPQNEASSSLRFESTRPVFKTKSTSGIWDLEWEASEGINFENKLLYTNFSNHRLTPTGLQSADIDGRELQIEPLMRFGADGDTWRGLAGLRYFRGTQDEFVNFNAYYGGVNTFDDKTETASAFAELSWALHPQVDVTFAGRVEREQRKRTGGSGAVNINFDETYNVFLPKVDLAWKPLDGQTLGAKIARGYNAGGAGMTFVQPFISYTYDSEYVWNYELYSRHRLKDTRVELTTNIFYNDYKDMQLPITEGSSSVIHNAEKVETYGAEFGARWQPTRDLAMFGSAGLLKAKIKRFSAASGAEGADLPRAPAVSANVGASYLITPGLELSGNVQYSDAYYSAYDKDPRGRIGAYWITNLQLAYTFAHGRATLFAQNLFDSDKRVMTYYGASQNVDYLSEIRRPRMIGASIELTF
ncbi:TonB-dependent receptor [Affinibrenneria salicis]|uniref:TonB-dependent receptor n=1 Tax=Affinibrenneria salicis TaxID=2590031 RepID=A0A5J5G312_9GAMM|nr:TonB-dependent receptor [Affinibrenneria salicis]KAA9001297.1 TonB-dependent receptor [Affinibrenneria salicis]